MALREVSATIRSRSDAGLWSVLFAALAGLLISFLPILQAAALLAPFVLILVFTEPLLGVALMLLVAPWGALEGVALGSGLLDSGQLLFLLALGAWLARGAVARRISLPAAHFLLPLALFVGVAFLSLLDASSLSAGFKEVLKWLEVGLVGLMVVDLSMTVDQRPIGRWLGLHADPWAWRIILFVILLGGLSQALIGIWQFGLRGSGPEHFQVAGGHFYRAYGTFEQPNPFGGFISWIAAMGVGAFLGEMMHGLKTRMFSRQHILWMVFLAAASASALLALVFSWSRGAWLGSVGGICAIIFFVPRKRFLGASLLAVGLVLLVIAWQSSWFPPAVVERLASFTGDLRIGDVRGADINDANYAVLERLAHWQSALDMATYDLATGVGFGNYETVYPAYALINWPDALGHAHNYYLNILAETGVMGLLAYLIFWIAIIWQTFHVIARSNWPERGMALGLLGAWVSLSIHHLLDKLYVNNLYLYLGAMLGALQLLHERACRKV